MHIAVEGIDGIGKSSAISRLRGMLAADHSVLTTTMAPVTLDLLKGFGRDVHGAEQAYWTQVSRRTKTQLFLTEAVVSADYLHDYFGSFDVVIFDRWWQTFHAYSTDEEFDERCRFLSSRLPGLDVVFHLRGDPGVCAQRLLEQDDWLTRQMSASELEPFLAALHARYEDVFSDDPARVAIDCDGLDPEQVAAIMFAYLCDRLSATPGKREPGAHSRGHVRLARPSGKLVALEGIDGAGKSTLVERVAAALQETTEVGRLASSSLALFKASAQPDPGEQVSSAIRRRFADEFRQQTYLVDGLVQLACLEREGAPIRLFDRWFPLFAVYQHQIVSDRALFDYLLSRYPVPDTVFYLDLPVDTAVRRLTARCDWMLDSLGGDETRRTLQSMVDVHRPRLAELGPVVRLIDGELPVPESTARICAELAP